MCFPEVVVLSPTAPPPGKGTATASVSEPFETAFNTVAGCHSRGLANTTGIKTRERRTHADRFIRPPTFEPYCIPGFVQTETVLCSTSAQTVDDLRQHIIREMI